MFCRFCGAAILPDSRFCSACGKRLAPHSPRREALVRKLRLKTPYPYAAAAFLLFLAWAFQPGPPPFDYTRVSMELELQGESAEVRSNLFRHHLSLIVVNVGDMPVLEVPVQIRARVDDGADHRAQVECDFLGRRFAVLEEGQEIPLVVILTDDIDAAGKRRYSIDGIVTAEPPFSVTYEVLAEGSEAVLASITRVVPEPDDGSDETDSTVGMVPPMTAFRES